jgi:hypothetical protein
VGLLAAGGDGAATRTEFEAILRPWQKAPWYRAELEKKALAMGVEVVTA